MKCKSLVGKFARYTAVVMIAAMAGGCASAELAGTDARFARPATATEKIFLEAADVAGRRAVVTDEVSWVGYNFNADGTFSADWGKGVFVPKGTWSVSDDGNLCLIDPSGRYWIEGDCYEYYGGDTFDEATVMHPAHMSRDTYTWYPAKVTRR